MSVVVVVPNWSPHPVTGGQFVERAIIRELAAVVDVHVLAVQDPSPGPFVKDAATTFHTCPRKPIQTIERLLGPLPAVALWSRGEGAQIAVRELIRTYQADHVIVSPSYTAVNVPADAPARLIVLAQNVEYRRVQILERGHAGLVRKAWLRLQAHRMRRLETSVLGRATVVLAMSQLDTATLTAMVRRTTPVIFTPALPDASLLALSISERPTDTILFMASLGYGPNLKTAVELVRTFLPGIRKTHPQARLILAGSNPPPDLLKLVAERKDVEIRANFENLADIFARATVFVAPLTRQEGISIKTLNALASGTPVVATSAVLASLGAEAGVHALVAEHPDDLAREVAKLLDDQELRLRMASASREFVTVNFSRRRLNGALRSALSVS